MVRFAPHPRTRAIESTERRQPSEIGRMERSARKILRPAEMGRADQAARGKRSRMPAEPEPDHTLPWSAFSLLA